MKKLFLSISCAFALSACTADQLAGYGAELLLPNSEAAWVNQAKRQTGLKLLTETSDVDQAYFKQHQQEFEKLLADFEYYRIMRYVLNAHGLKVTTPITQTDREIADLKRQKANYVAPTSSERCVSGADVYNGYGYAGSYCDRTVTVHHDEQWRKADYADAMKKFDAKIRSLQSDRARRVTAAKEMGVDSTFVKDSNNAAKQMQIIQQKLDAHCNQMMKKPEVKWIMAESRPMGKMTHREVSVVTTTRGKSNCVSSLFIGFRTQYTHDYFVEKGRERFFGEYGTRLFGEADRTSLNDMNRKRYAKEQYIRDSLRTY